MKSKPKYGAWLIALGAALGTVAGVIAGNMGAWLAIGVAIGIALGQVFQKNEPRCPECTEMHREHSSQPNHDRPELRAKS